MMRRRRSPAATSNPLRLTGVGKYTIFLGGALAGGLLTAALVAALCDPRPEGRNHVRHAAAASFGGTGSRPTEDVRPEDGSDPAPTGPQLAEHEPLENVRFDGPPELVVYEHALQRRLLFDGTMRIADQAAWNEKRTRIRRELKELLGVWPAAAPTLKPRFVGAEQEEGYRRLKVRYRVADDEEGSAYLLVPDGVEDANRRLPAIIAMHQSTPHGMREPCGFVGSPNLHYAKDLVIRGFVVLAPDTITAGERIAPGERPYDTTRFYRRHPEWSIMGKMVWDHQRAMDFLETLPYVDRSRVAAIGHSLGGHNAVFLAALDDRVAAVVASCGYVALTADPGRERWARESPSLFIYIPKLRPYVTSAKPSAPLAFHELLAVIAPRPLFQSTALYDECFPYPSGLSVLQMGTEVEQVYSLLGAADDLRTIVLNTGHDFPPEVRQKAYEFLDRVLCHAELGAVTR